MIPASFGTARNVDFKGHHISKQGLWIAIEGCRSLPSGSASLDPPPELRRDSIKSFRKSRWPIRRRAPSTSARCRSAPSASAPLRSAPSARLTSRGRWHDAGLALESQADLPSLAVPVRLAARQKADRPYRAT